MGHIAVFFVLWKLFGDGDRSLSEQAGIPRYLRRESRKNRRVLARYSVTLLIASWDLTNGLYDILEDKAYSPRRCKAYGDAWDSQFTSYLFGQYFAGVHIVREMTQFFSHIKGSLAEQVKTLIWKIQDEFITMHTKCERNWRCAGLKVISLPCKKP
ncbi:hypothetical protein QBC37DRAFT_373898 [Rhypophila decipiens]|uniref:Uncharacterized protein n=1 Tax=Rhypophila decipiens TaxID=261697 RepID=A0AAN7B7U6_9PEZI|nr:hypothetical protein QBC37DRAFT_373898 [Rhypophila decipiens]